MTTGLRTGVDVRGPTAADAVDLGRLLAAAHPDAPPPTARHAAERLEAIARDPAAAMLVATGYDGAVIGLVSLAWAATPLADRPAARLTALLVAEDERRRGIGRLLVKAAAQLARSAGCETLEAPAGDGAAFWAASGFLPVGGLVSRGLRRRAG